MNAERISGIEVKGDFDTRTERRRMVGKGEGAHPEHRFTCRGAGVLGEGFTSVEVKLETSSERIAQLFAPGATVRFRIEVVEP
jgi:hypothetical protein